MKHENELEKRTQVERKSFSIIDSTVQRTKEQHTNIQTETSKLAQ